MGAMKEFAMSPSPDIIRKEYFEWLCGLVQIDEPDHSYWLLARTLHGTEFYSILPMDVNREEDGKHLRSVFLDNTGYVNVLEGPCSVLELLIGVAIRMNDVLTGDEFGDISGYFWELIENLGLDFLDDDTFFEENPSTFVKSVLFCFIKRKYKRDGEGGIFPQKGPKRDQKDVEIWYQMHEYLKNRA